MSVLFLGFFSSIDASSEGKTTSFNETGVFFLHIKDLLVQSGLLHAKVSTNLNTTRDMLFATMTLKNYERACNSTTGYNAKKYYKEKINYITNLALLVQSEILSRHSMKGLNYARFKRLHGVFPWAWEKLNAVLFGTTDSHDVDLSGWSNCRRRCTRTQNDATRRKKIN